MKNKFKLFLSLFAIIMYMKSGLAQTTLEEYNYLKKGYKTQVETGLDMKKGYNLEKVDEVTFGVRKAELSKLIKTVEGKQKTAAYLLIYQRQSYGKEYLCIPHPKSSQEIQRIFLKDLYDGDGDSSNRLQIISFILSRGMVW